MTISSRVRQQFLAQENDDQLIRIPQTKCHAPSPFATPSSSSQYHQESKGLWSALEHERFLQALELFPHGPWKHIAAYIGTKTARQAMCHAQKYRQKIARRKRGLAGSQRADTPKSPTVAAAITAPSKSQCEEHQSNQEHKDRHIPNNAKFAPPEAQTLYQVRCPSSPSEVSSSSSTTQLDVNWTALPNAQEFKSCLQYPQTQHQHLVGPFDACVQHSNKGDSLSDSLLQDDHEVLLSTINEFLDSLEVHQLELHF